MSRRSDFRFENLVLVLFTLSFAGLFVVASQSESYNFDGIASMSFPKWIIGFVIVLCIVKLVMNYVSHPKSNSSEETGKGNGVINGLTLQERRTKIGVSLVAIVLYAVLWKVFGFALCTIVLY